MNCPVCQTQLRIATLDRPITTGPRTDADRLAVYAKCPRCGYAPGLYDQPVCVKRLLDEAVNDLELACLV